MSRSAFIVAFAATAAACGLAPPTERDLTIPIRNDWEHAAILEVTEAPDEVEGRAVAVIARSIRVEPGEDLTARIQAPRDRWTLRLSNGDRGFINYTDLLRASRDDADAYVHVDHRGSISLVADR